MQSHLRIDQGVFDAVTFLALVWIEEQLSPGGLEVCVPCRHAGSARAQSISVSLNDQIYLAQSGPCAAVASFRWPLQPYMLSP